MTGSEPTWLTLLIQVPLVGVFIWYSLRLTERTQQSLQDSQTRYGEMLERQAAQYEARNRALIEAITSSSRATCESVNALTETLTEHDRLTRAYIARQEPTRPRKAGQA